MADRLPGPARLLLLGAGLLLLALELPGAVELWDRPHHGLRLRDTQVELVEPRGPADRAGVRSGDRVLALGGTPVRDVADWRAALHGRRSGGPSPLQVRRGDRVLELPLQLEPPSPAQRARHYLLSAVGLSFLFLGMVTYLRRADAVGRWFHLTCLLLALPFLDLPGSSNPVVVRAVELSRNGLALLLPAAFLRFFLVFPEGAATRQRERRRNWLLLPPLLLWLPELAGLLQPGIAGRELRNLAGLLSALLFATYLLAALLVFARKVRRAAPWSHASQLRLALLGLGAGLAPFVLSTLARQLWPAHTLPLDELSVVALPLVPAAFSHALLRSGTVDASYIVRQAVIALVLVLPLGSAAAVGLWALGPRPGTLRFGAVWAATVGLLLLALWGVARLRQPAAAWIDTLLWPERRRLRQQAHHLGRALGQLRRPDLLGERLCQGSCELLGSESAFVLVRRGEGWEALASTRPGLVPVPPGDKLAHDALHHAELMEVPPERSDRAGEPWSGQPTRLLCPLRTGDEVVGLLALGPPRRGRRYSAQQLHHLQAVARQAAVQYENALLHGEDLARERLRTEMELARDIQRRLLPQSPLEVGELGLCGQTVSSSQVGGDLFDHFLLSDGRIVLLVADASGKGVPASLLIGNARTAVRETVRPELPLEEVMAHLNEVVHGDTELQHFVAMFLGVLQPATGLLEYVVAGIELPLWRRAATGRVERLHRGGPVLGVQAGARYQSGLVRLAPGDLLLAYSDGVVDQEDPQGEDFGAGRLLELFSGQPAGATAEEVAGSLVRALDRFAQGEPSDDRTVLVVARAAGTEGAVARG